ncbi:hypothetical protein [Thalassobellus citreus]|uniref:hypothetical protein n=1 Tax=Thalassobellus citreus TaxID=3367752 RepID=UPI0037A57BAB
MQAKLLYINENRTIVESIGVEVNDTFVFNFEEKNFVFALFLDGKRATSSELTTIEQYACTVSGIPFQTELKDYSQTGRALILQKELFTIVKGEQIESPVIQFPAPTIQEQAQAFIDLEIQKVKLFSGLNPDFMYTYESRELFRTEANIQNGDDGLIHGLYGFIHDAPYDNVNERTSNNAFKSSNHIAINGYPVQSLLGGLANASVRLFFTGVIVKEYGGLPNP